jgi:branched-chain amino acid transport system substrate-binding protein
MRRWDPLAVVLLAAFAAGCGDDSPDRDKVRGDTAVVYASMPLGGVSRERAEAVVAGARHALREVGARAGGKNVRLAVLNSVEPGERVWDPSTVEDNAERAAEDRRTIAYIGELDFGGSAVSVPVTNDRAVLQIAPQDGLTSLTRTPPGRPRSVPARLYPGDRRSLIRLVPNDLEVARVLARRIAADGVRRITLVGDDSVYGAELAAQVDAIAPAAGLEVVEVEDLRADDLDRVRGLVEDVAEKPPGAIVFAGVAGPATRLLLTELARALPNLPVYGGAGLAAGLDAADLRRVTIVTPVRPPAGYPASARRLLQELDRGERADALYGYEAMRLVLRALRRAGADRRAVADAALSAGDQRSPALGAYTVRGSGDVSGMPLAVSRDGAAEPAR